MSSTAVTLKGYIALQQSNILNKNEIRDFEYVNLGSVCFCTLYLIFPFYKTNTKTIENHSQPVCKFVFFAYVFWNACWFDTKIQVLESLCKVRLFGIFCLRVSECKSDVIWFWIEIFLLNELDLFFVSKHVYVFYNLLWQKFLYMICKVKLTRDKS